MSLAYNIKSCWHGSFVHEYLEELVNHGYRRRRVRGAHGRGGTEPILVAWWSGGGECVLDDGLCTYELAAYHLWGAIVGHSAALSIVCQGVGATPSPS